MSYEYDSTKSIVENYEMFKIFMIEEYGNDLILKTLSVLTFSENQYKDIKIDLLMNDLNHSFISDFGILFLRYKMKGLSNSNFWMNQSLLNLKDNKIIKEYYKPADENTYIIGSAAFNGFNNNDDPYVNNLRSSNQVPFGNQQVNVTQPDPSIQNNGDEIAPYQFNFAKQRFTSPEEVLNSVMGVNNQNQQVQMYQQPMYIDQWGNVVYYNPQQF